MLTGDWSWKGNVLYLTNVPLERGERNTKERELKSLMSPEFSHCPESEHTKAQPPPHPPRVVAWRITANVRQSNLAVWIELMIPRETPKDTNNPAVRLASLVVITPLNNRHCWWKSLRCCSGTNVHGWGHVLALFTLLQFSDFLPHSASDVVATGYQMKPPRVWISLEFSALLEMPGIISVHNFKQSHHFLDTAMQNFHTSYI